MRGRGQPLAAVVVLALVAAGGVFLEREVGPRPARAGVPEATPSGAWLCPHGGGPSDWEVTLYVANPGPDPVRIRVQDFGRKRPSMPADYTLDPGAEMTIAAAADGRERASTVEYFGGWVAAGWVAHAGGDEGGVAAEPCLPEPGRTWFVPDGTTVRGQDAYVVVMNPFATDAVFTVTLFTERGEAIQTKDWTDYVLPGERSAAFPLNEKALGYHTVSAEIEVSIGRVAAASLGVSAERGIRSAGGIPGPVRTRFVLPGGADQGRSDLVVLNPSTEEIGIGAALLGRDTEEAVGGLQEASQEAESAGTYSVITDGPSTIDLRTAEGGVGAAAARRTFGVSWDQGSTAGVSEPAGAWVVLPAVAGPPFNPHLFLTNPGQEPAEVTLSMLSPPDAAPPPAPITLIIPAGRTVQAPPEFVQAGATAAVLARSEEGTFVPVMSSYALGTEGVGTFAVAVGVPIPPAWA